MGGFAWRTGEKVTPDWIFNSIESPAGVRVGPGSGPSRATVK